MTTMMTMMMNLMNKVIAEVIHVNNHDSIQAKDNAARTGEGKTRTAIASIPKRILVDSLNPTALREEDKVD